MLGTTFPAEALIAVSGRDEPAVRAALAELVRREVLSVSADPLSPEKGSYGFAQNMLRQVAYDTLSRRDRKARHLAVAAHLRAAFAGDGEEVTDVIARHYLDALKAVPDDPDTAEIRGQAIGVLIRAAERAERTGAPARAAASYAAAAGPDPGGPAGRSSRQPPRACCGSAPPPPPSPTPAGPGPSSWRPRPVITTCRPRQARAAARAQAIAGRALREWGHHADAREQLTAAVEVLRADPDTDTVRALGDLATLEVFAGSPDADKLSAEALSLGQASGRRRRPAQPAVRNPRGLPCPRRPAPSSGRLPSAKPRGWPAGRRQRPWQRIGEPVGPLGAGPTRRRRRRLPGPPPGTRAGWAPGAAWRLRSATWPMRC